MPQCHTRTTHTKAEGLYYTVRRGVYIILQATVSHTLKEGVYMLLQATVSHTQKEGVYTAHHSVTHTKGYCTPQCHTHQRRSLLYNTMYTTYTKGGSIYCTPQCHTHHAKGRSLLHTTVQCTPQCNVRHSAMYATVQCTPHVHTKGGVYNTAMPCTHMPQCHTH